MQGGIAILIEYATISMACGNVLIFLAVIGLVLFLSNIFLMYQLQRRQALVDFKVPGSAVMDFFSLPMDSSGQYRIQKYFLKPRLGSQKGQQDVTMVTHCTANHLHYLLNLCEHWKGPIAVAVFVTGEDIIPTYSSLLGLHRCSQATRKRVTVHVVFTVSHPPLLNDLGFYLKQATHQKLNCEDLLARISGKDAQMNKMWNYANAKVPYPNNLLRNVARRNSQTDYVFVVDVDMMCSGKLYGDYLNFARRTGLFTNVSDKKVFVVPAFESQIKLAPSMTKQELVALWNSGTVQPFYYQVCWKCQKNTDYEKWKSHRSPTVGLHVAYTVDWKDPWEPFYIGPKHLPLYDERFKQYGFNRISQVCETHIAGYDFAVLNDAFLVHQGFKIKDAFHNTKDKENARNRELFRTFKKELKLRYPLSPRRC